MKPIWILGPALLVMATMPAWAWHPAQLTKPDQCKVGMRVVNNTGEAGTVTSVVNDWCYFKKDSGKDGALLYWLLRPEAAAAEPGAQRAGGAAAPARNSRPAADGSKLLLGVYECRVYGNIMHGAFFGLIDGSTYRNFDGKRGSYRFDAATRVLELTSGSSKGLRYLQTTDRHFYVLDDKGRQSGADCVLNESKRIDGRW